MNSWLFMQSLDRRKRENRDIGYIYIVRNRIYKEPIVKIGKTSRPPQLRLRELSSSTAIADDFELVYYVHVSNISMAETWVHNELRNYRYNPAKEFFKIGVKEAIGILDMVADNFPIGMGITGQVSQYLPQDLRTEIITCPACHVGNKVKKILVKVTVTCPVCKVSYEVG